MRMLATLVGGVFAFVVNSAVIENNGSPMRPGVAAVCVPSGSRLFEEDITVDDGNYDAIANASVLSCFQRK